MGNHLPIQGRTRPRVSAWRSRVYRRPPIADFKALCQRGGGQLAWMTVAMELTELLRSARDGDKSAADRLFTLIYDDLHRLAAGQLIGHGGIATTSLVHETYLRLSRPQALDLQDRQHLFAVAARAMRQIIVNRARSRLASKRGGGAPEVTLSAADSAPLEQQDAQLLALDQALEQLAQAEPRLAQLVELRFFGGMELPEAGATLGLSATTLKRDWRKARAFLHASIDGGLP